MKYLLLILLSCNTYQGVIVSEDEFTKTARAKVSDSHYIWVTIDTDSFEVGDTVYIDKTNLRVLR